MSGGEAMSKPVLVFGVSGEQGEHVIRGLLNAKKYSPIYGATSAMSHVSPSFLEEMKDTVTILEVNLNKQADVERVLTDTKATSIFLVTTTDLLPDDSAMGSLKEAEEIEYDSIKSFFDTLVAVHRRDKISRHVVFSSLDDVKAINDESDVPFIQPLEDGSVVPHYSGKGRAGKYALALLADVPDLTITLLTLPFLHSNMVASTIPLPNEGMTQWTISACFGDAAIDMFSVSDLAYIVPSVLEKKQLYDGYNVRVSAEKVTMGEVAAAFADLFGKDVIYNPLSVEEMASMPIPASQAFAQMCQFLADPRSAHDVDVTETVMFPRKPQLFQDWLLTHSDNEAFEKVGLALDVEPILSVTVFGATHVEGRSVVKGLLADRRKQYTIRAAVGNVESDEAKAVRDLDNRVTLVQADFDDAASCANAVDGVDGAFLVTDFYGAGRDSDVEERHARNVIDACEASRTVRHLVFSTLESVEDMNRELKLGLTEVEDAAGKKSALPPFDAKARAAAYARTKKISVTYVLMPVYSERFFELMSPEVKVNEDTGESTHVFSVPDESEHGGQTKVMCMSVEELGPAVANIFDSYQVFAGHEIGLVTDFVTMSEAAEMIEDVFFKDDEKDDAAEKKSKVEQKKVEKDKWLQKGDTYARDLGQMFSYYAMTDAVKKRRSVAKTLQLVPDARPLRQWLEENRNNVEFRQKLGLR